MLRVVDYYDPVDDDLGAPAGRVAVWLRIGRLVLEISGIEDRDIGAIPLSEEAAVAQLQRARRATGHLVNSLLQRQQPLLMHVMADHAREGTVEARMRHA